MSTKNNIRIQEKIPYKIKEEDNKIEIKLFKNKNDFHKKHREIKKILGITKEGVETYKTISLLKILEGLGLIPNGLHKKANKVDILGNYKFLFGNRQIFHKQKPIIINGEEYSIETFEKNSLFNILKSLEQVGIYLDKELLHIHPRVTNFLIVTILDKLKKKNKLIITKKNLINKDNIKNINKIYNKLSKELPIHIKLY